jgi:hypothetical protein
VEEEFELNLQLEEDGNLDDSVASDLDHGIDVASEDPHAGDGDEPGLDVGVGGFEPDLGEGEGEGNGEDDEAGPVGDDVGSDLGQEEEFDADEAEGGSDRLDEFVPAELPSLDAEAGEMDAGPDNEPIELSVGEEEDAPRRSELAWTEVVLPVRMPSCTSIVVERSTPSLLAGGREVFTVDDAGVRRTLAANLDDTVTSLVQGMEPGTALFTTRSGQLWRCAPEKRMLERVVAFGGDSGIGSLSLPEILLGGPTPSQRPALLLHVKDDRGGTLLESTDYGTTWRRVELGGVVTSLSNGSPPLCLVDTGRALRFFLSESSGGFSPIGSPYSGETDAPEMVTREDAVILLSPGHGVSVSANHGATFKAAPGCSRATAVAAGRLGTRLSAFAALFDRASGRATLVWIDAASAEVFAVATIEPSDEDDDDDFCRVESLAWDPHSETLWAGGLFGLRRFRRPSSA